MRLGLPALSLVSRPGGGGAAASPLRFATHANLIGNSIETASGTQLGRAMKVIHYVGSGDLIELRAMFCGWALGGSNSDGALLPGNSFTCPEAWVTKAGDATGKRFTWSGSNSVTINSGDTEIISDPIDPIYAATLLRGTKLFLGYRTEVASAGLNFPGGDGGNGGSDSGFQGFSYNPSNTTITNLQGSSDMGNGGAGDIAGTNNTLCPPLMLIGKFSNGSVGVFMAAGDSITDHANDIGYLTAVGRGWFTRSLFDNATTFTNPRAGCKLAKPGGAATVWAAGAANGAQSKLRGLSKYANRLLERYGINTIGGTGTQLDADNTRAEKKVIWDTFRAANTGTVLVAVLPLTPKTASTDSFATVANQTPTSGLGQQIGLLDADLTSLAGQTGQHDVYLENTTTLRGSASKANANYWRWAAPGFTVDGVHPEPTPHETMAGPVRTWMQANT